MNSQSETQIPIITIDGPGGSGKGTISLLLVKQLAWHFLDSGALYRTLALAAKLHSINFADEPALAILAESLDLQFQSESPQKPARIMLEGDDVTDTVRTPEYGGLASKIAVNQKVRDALLQRQRDFAKAPGLIADGRDMGNGGFSTSAVKDLLRSKCS